MKSKSEQYWINNNEYYYVVICKQDQKLIICLCMFLLEIEYINQISVYYDWFNSRAL